MNKRIVVLACLALAIGGVRAEGPASGNLTKWEDPHISVMVPDSVSLMNATQGPMGSLYLFASADSGSDDPPKQLLMLTIAIYPGQGFEALPAAERAAAESRYLESRIKRRTDDATGPVARSTVSWQGHKFQRLAWDSERGGTVLRNLAFMGIANDSGIAFAAAFDSGSEAAVAPIIERSFATLRQKGDSNRPSGN